MKIYKTIYEAIVDPLRGQRATELERVANKLKSSNLEAERASGKVLEIVHRTMMIGAALTAEIEGMPGQRIYIDGKHYEWSGDSWDLIKQASQNAESED